MENSNSHNKKITLGICAMNKKTKSKHMQNIMRNLEKFEDFQLVLINEEITFYKDIEDWPIVDALIIFFSSGFPYNKGLNYVRLRKPFLINDFESQKIFWDRREILRVLNENNIPTPLNIVVNRGEPIDNDGEKSKDSNNDSFENIEDVLSYLKKNRENDYFKENQHLVQLNQTTIGLLNDDTRRKILDDIEALNKEYKILESIDKEMTNNEFYQFLKKIEENQKDFPFKIESIMQEIQIVMTKHYLNQVNKDLIEYDDHIEYRGKKIFKPFVEKPCNGDDHAIHIYYPPNLGGGHKVLFRKTQNLCSLYISNEDNIRRDKSYIYEEFLQTDGFDIKVYTIGPEYAHAEARKSPCLDGIVWRTEDGKEVRYPVNLTPFEKELAMKVVNIFKQNICGFDILRSRGKSYVCDVNGWSFVKGNRKYHEDCAILIRKMILMAIDPLRYQRNPLSIKFNMPTYDSLSLPNRPTSNNQQYVEELRSVVAVFRHADRSPKQKMKLLVDDKRFLSLFNIYCEKNNFKEIKLKKPKQLMEILQITTEILQENDIDESNICDKTSIFFNKLFQLKMVLEKNLNFQGMTRKVQLKPINIEKLINENGEIESFVTEALFIFKWGGDITHSGIQQAKLLGNTFRVKIYPSYDNGGDGLLRLHSTYRHDLKVYSSDEGRCMKSSAAFLQGLLQLDGNLIPIISSMVRKDQPVLDILDVSIEEVARIKQKVKEELSELLHHDGNLLEKFNEYFKNQTVFKKDDEKDHALVNLMKQINNPLEMMKKIYSLMYSLLSYIKTMLTQEEVQLDAGTYFIIRHSLLQKRKTSDNSVEKAEMELTGAGINNLNNINNSNVNVESILENRKNRKSKSFKTSSEDKLTTTTADDNYNNFDCEDEKVILIYKRWIKLYQDFYNTKKKRFDISKIPDIYDNIKYDIIHNKEILNEDSGMLNDYVTLLANFVMPVEYGITIEEKIKIGLKVTGPLLNKIHNDLLWWFQPKFGFEGETYSGLDRAKLDQEIKSAWRHIRTRFYFTSASHLYSLINTVVFGLDSSLLDHTDANQGFIKELKNVLDLDYCAHIMFRLYENFNVELNDPKRFRLEIIMSPGTNADPYQADENHLIPISPWIVLNKNLTLTEMVNFFDKIMPSDDSLTLNEDEN